MKFTPAERDRRRQRVAELRILGWTVNEICKELKVGRLTVRSDIKAVFDPALRESNREILEIELGRLETATKSMMKRMMALDDPTAVARLLDIMKRRSDYLGLDAAQRGSDHNDVDAWLSGLIDGEDEEAEDGDLDAEIDP